eukprot:2052475-Pleurochrysis_carterae.AAC.2
MRAYLCVHACARTDHAPTRQRVNAREEVIAVFSRLARADASACGNRSDAWPHLDPLRAAAGAGAGAGARERVCACECLCTRAS